MNDALGDRMKTYEEVTKTKLVRRMPVIIRLDGKAFHSFTRGFRKPFDKLLMKTMHATMKYLCENIQGCVLGYTQSDEITLVLVDYAKLESCAWFDNEVQKMVSISSSMATFAFNKYFNEYYLEQLAEKGGETDDYDLVYDKARRKGALFDSRVFNVPREDVTNCVYWRQKDAERNSVSALAQSLFSHKSLQGLSQKDLVAKVEQEKGIIWGELPTTCKRGCCCVKKSVYYLDGEPIKWVNWFGSQCFSRNGHLCTLSKKSDGTFYALHYEVDTSEPDLGAAAGTQYSPVPEDINVVERSVWTIDEDIPQFKEEGRDYIEKLIM